MNGSRAIPLGRRGLLIGGAAALAAGWWCLPQRSTPYFETDVPGVGQTPVPPPGPDLPVPEGVESFVNSIGMRMIRIPAGEFVRGSLAEERGRKHDESPVVVKMTKAFWISQTEVTQAQYRAVQGCDRSRFRGDLLPATDLTGHFAFDFCMSLSFMEQRTYRFPTETEWEYACRAGTTTPFHTGEELLPTQARFAADVAGADEPAAAGGGPRPVGSYPPNAWGLHDMHGNVAEWVDGPYHPTNKAVLEYDDMRYFVASFDTPIRGGGWASPAIECRSARRDRAQPSVAADWIGFRVVMEEENGDGEKADE